MPASPLVVDHLRGLGQVEDLSPQLLVLGFKSSHICFARLGMAVGAIQICFIPESVLLPIIASGHLLRQHHCLLIVHGRPGLHEIPSVLAQEFVDILLREGPLGSLPLCSSGEITRFM